jgi:subtilisin family serine protease
MSQNTVAQTTGRYLILFREDSVSEGVQMLSEAVDAQAAEILIFGDLGVAVVDAEPAQLNSLNIASQQDSPILAIEPEQVVYALGGDELGDPESLISGSTLDVSVDYLRGYQDAITNLMGRLIPSDQARSVQAAVDESTATWGLQATKVINSRFSGQGIKVAVLDTGFDFTHPDFLGRQIVSKSFVEDEDVQDGHGHGTHCVGTTCGPQNPGTLPRYGIAYDAEILVGKVLSNQGSGTDSQILQGIEWAIANDCHIISMSLGSPTRPGQSYSRIYEAVAQRALNRGTLIVAAAGNESRRSLGIVNPVARPANCPSILAVAALDVREQVANFSNRGLNLDGGQVDIAGPGVNVRSSWVMPIQYRTISGTSMATPHVAGIAALHAEAGGVRGHELWNRLIRNARRLPLPSTDVGAGLVQAP